MLQKHISLQQQPEHHRKKVKILPYSQKNKHPHRTKQPRIHPIPRNSLENLHNTEKQRPSRLHPILTRTTSSKQFTASLSILAQMQKYKHFFRHEHQLAHKYLNSIYPPQNQRHFFQHFKPKKTKIQEKTVSLHTNKNRKETTKQKK